ncbi:hypothetical protein MYX07_03645 [Patescibacteria group bacterium AH-259-L07]|nr:hypothetical protein [Patescibacteria group bacterium AH-259-L07]
MKIERRNAMYWFWITISVLVVFICVWLWKGAHCFGQNRLKRLMSKIVSVAIVADGAFTLIDQSARYWHNFSVANEDAVIGKALLEWHPLAFTLGIICWAILACFVIYKGPALFSYTAFFALFFGHSIGAWDRLGGTALDWLPFLHPELSKYLFYIFLGLVLALVIKRARRLK